MTDSGAVRPGSGTSRWGWWMCVWWWWWWCNGVGTLVEAQENCDNGSDVAVAAVVSVFVTLVVVAIVLVIVFIILRKRHGGFLFPPKKTRKSLVYSDEDNSRITRRGDGCYDNPVFSAQDTVDLEEGQGRTSPRRKMSPTKEPPRARSSAVPDLDEPDSSCRRGSSGSLNNCPDSETVSVWLQSQDIIGLGFNISGNMRDGIYVSQLHNRGPAVESGKIQVGDRIRSVTIVYDNMVYEDALTILSYASPYPVRVTLQKERVSSADSRGGSSEQLNHPLYRSQSFDALPRLSKDTHVFKAKKWRSEMKSETRKDSPKRAEEERRVKALSQSLPPVGWNSSVSDVLGLSSDVTVHTPDGSPSPAGYRPSPEKTAPEKRVDFQGTPTAVAPSDTESLQVKKNPKKGKLDAEAVHGLASLMDQTRDRKNDDDDPFLPQTADVVGASPKTPPNKPERKKKSSSASVVSEDSPHELSNSDLDGEEICVAVRAGHIHALPPRAHDLGPEVEEEEIQPSYVKREAVINIEGFDFAPVETSDAREAAEERPPSPPRYAYKRASRPASPEIDPVEEDPIEAAVASRDTQTAPRPWTKSPNTTSSNTKDVKRVQDTSILSEESLERLVLKDPLASSVRGGRKPGQDLEDANSRFLLQNSSSQPWQDKSSGDFTGTGRSGWSGFGEGGVFVSSQSDSQLQHHAGDGRMEKRDSREDGLEWSGQRLVRSGSFSEIPLDDSVSDWTDRNTLNDDDDNSTTSGKRSATDTNPESDPETNPPRILSSRGIFKGRENLSNLSDLSNSVSSSRSSSPVLTNGSTGEGVSVHVPGSNMGDGRTAIIELTPTSDTNANSKTVDFPVLPAPDNVDC